MQARCFLIRLLMNDWEEFEEVLLREPDDCQEYEEAQ